MEQLPLFHGVRGRPVVVWGDGPEAEARRRLVREAGGLPTDDAGSGARLAFVAGVADPEDAARRLRALGLLVNVADRPELCDFTVPAIVDRAPVTLAIGTAGHSASLARALKERFDLMLPPTLGQLARAIRAARDPVARALPEPAVRRAFWARLMATGGPLDPLAPPADPEGAIAKALTGTLPPAPADLIEIRVPTGGVEELRLAEVRALASADWLLICGPVPPALLALARRDARRAEGPDPPPEARGRIVRLRAAEPCHPALP
ncbi:MAG: bifunctional precorrin-2 dehydrogenase/sirohydrochlorin ferrochelatase [Sphingomonadaceae bacterium]|uniref:precorrin-2 dehydrogenase/sirohydrochlorin ferrochelatase family protein n=1 Tax=Thermaurantiacus sp. TaxID=2820283 RepID=UPI00298EE3A2|nr:bifunctional precorrin-2 dehydrogenase/sirohydrochlorin ferrochelatase [Thermaurantiacus sp.]MCS6986969.1 bifunctional precorrin-2 dehydrogenase/sirohydrochlorin ferrochelatase [Sphingomonadaceae bacterium]MDW8415431.1 bifunctional precorrin-2 dehydrogenase/sirohydrochlorin ferrochelatase [Thermaurantiacus sp.]